MPKVVILHGPPAAGKLTIARHLADITGLKLFHNHLVVDAVLALFPFGSPNFVKYREKLWMEMMGDAVKDDVSFIFTFNPEATVRADFMKDLSGMIESAGGTVFWIEVCCGDEHLQARMDAESRLHMKKLASFEFFTELRDQNAFLYPLLPVGLSIDSGALEPAMAAKLISDYVTDAAAK